MDRVRHMRSLTYMRRLKISGFIKHSVQTDKSIYRCAPSRVADRDEHGPMERRQLFARKSVKSPSRDLTCDGGTITRL